MTEAKPKTFLQLSVLEERLAVCRLDPRAGIPAWATSAPFFSLTRTADELSVVCPERDVPDGVMCERGWRAFRIEGPLDFALTGVLSSVATPLAGAGVSIFVIATHDTDYVLVKGSRLDLAASVLREQGHVVDK